MGDRYFGTVGVDDVIGKAALIVWPVSRFTFLDSPDIQATEAAALAAAGGSGVEAPVATASVVAPWAIGLAGALPIVAWRRRRHSRSD
jgi:signal peptidase I